jgi:predicted outer membrane repeat protein
MHIKHLIILVALVLAPISAVSPAQAGGVVTVCDEAHLLAALVDGGTVTFTCSGTITLTNTIAVATDTTIDSSGQDVTISGNYAVTAFSVDGGVILTLNALTVADGRALFSHGGGIANAGTLTVTNSMFSNNHADGDVYCGGGGIDNTGTAHVSNSIFSGNRAHCEGGGGILNHGTLIVSNSIFSGNSAAIYGGGIDNYGELIVSNSTFSGNYSGFGGGINNRHILTVSNSTFSNNSADYGGGIRSNHTLTVSNSTFSRNGAQVGGGINRGGGTAMLKNTIVASSWYGGNCSGTFIDGGGNLSYPDITCPGLNADPLLGPLQDNGGPTWTMALGPGSAAIDAGNDATCAADPVNNRDQRGVVRPQGVHCDIGAFERPIKWLPLMLVE